MKPTIWVFIFCLVVAFLLCAPSSPTEAQSKHRPNVSKGISRESKSHRFDRSIPENNRLAFENIIAVHNTYFAVFISGLSVYFGVVGACWKFALGANGKTPTQKGTQLFFLGTATIASVALYIGMWYSLSGCIARQECLNDLATKLGISQINLYLLPSSVKVSMCVIAILGTTSFVATIVILLSLVVKRVKRI